MARIIVTGAGIAGLGTAMLLANDGHDVTVLERDPAAPPDTADGAWAAWERRGVNQFRMLHFFLARFREILDTELPEAAAALDERGALRVNVMELFPPEITGGFRPGDERYTVITGRRPVVESALAAAADANPAITVRRGVAVGGLLTNGANGSAPHVVGVRTEDGEEVRGDLVIDTTGRRSPLPRWLTEAGADAPAEELDDCGFVYYGRHFCSPSGELPPLFGPALQHYDSISTLTLAADNGTWAVGVIASAKDKAMRAVKDPELWSAVVRAHPLVAHWIDAQPLDDDVAVMARIEDRHRSLVVDGRPVATGLLAVGDSWACTTPSVGRGASIGMSHAVATRDLLRKIAPADHEALALAHHETTMQTVEPWYRSTLRFDRLRLEEIDAQIEQRPYETDDPTYGFRKAMGQAAPADPDVLRAGFDDAFLFRSVEELMEDPEVREKVERLGAGWEDAPIVGPSRAELEQLLAGT